MKNLYIDFDGVILDTMTKSYEEIEKNGIDKKEAMKLVAKDRGVSKRDIYNALL